MPLPNPAKHRSHKRDGYGKRHWANFDKEKFEQAKMKFVLKNPVQDGGCPLYVD